MQIVAASISLNHNHESAAVSLIVDALVTGVAYYDVCPLQHDAFAEWKLRK